MTDQQNPVVLITGSARRIGAEMARHFHQAGFNIALHYRSSAHDAQQLADELNRQRPDSAHSFQADMNNMAEVTAMAEQVLEHYRRLDVLINNASGFYPTAAGSVTEQQWDELINSNVKAAFFLSQALTPALKKQRGCIINIVDIHAEKPMKKHSVYCMAKAALRMMTLSLAKELAPDIRVNGVSPGAILWPEHEDSQQQQAILERIALGKTGNADDIAEAVLFLATKAPYITGQIIAVDGGRSLNM